MLHLSNHHKTTVTLEGSEVRLRIKKFTKDEDLAFSPTFEYFGRQQAAFDEDERRFRERYLAERATVRGVPVEQLPKEDVPNEVALRGLLEASLSEEARAKRRQAEHVHKEQGDAFAVEAIGKYVSVEPGQIYDEDRSAEILTGEDLARHFEGRPDVLADLTREIFLQNRLSSAQKKTFSLLRASMAISAASATGTGPTPGATAENAGPSTTAGSAPATGESSPIPFGATALSTATAVPSSASPLRSNAGSRGSTRRTKRASTATGTSSCAASPSQDLEASPTRTPV